MTNVIDAVYKDRLDLAQVLKKYDGIRRIFEDLYPDKAHFIYELLQNAEDTGATETRFLLSEESLIFEHNGRPFNEADIFAITNIGVGTKKSDEDTIGRFGIGFKAVFACTETPQIWSPTFSFQINEFVLPLKLAPDKTIAEVTRFKFPFNSPMLTEEKAYSLICTGLKDLSENTLLFLSNIESITWEIQGKSKCELLRIQHSDSHVEVMKQMEKTSTRSAHFLKFRQPVEGLESQYVAIAFLLEFLPKIKAFNPEHPLSNQFQIVAARPGHVAAFFTAEKETSGLKFHLHAPFVPEVSRASIKNTPSNIPLFQQLATLVANSLYSIRDMGLLTENFLKVLPNPSDEIPDRYQSIKRTIVNEMNENPLTPTYSKTYKPAKFLLNGPASLKQLLTDQDLNALLENVNLDWAIGASQKNSRVDKFLSSLDITEWGIEEFVEILKNKLRKRENIECLDTYPYIRKTYGPDHAFVESILSPKDDKWHQKLYAMLYREVDSYDTRWHLLNLCIVRLETGEYRQGKECCFPTENIVNMEEFPFVSRGICERGKGKQKDDARSFLERLEVRDVEEVDQIKVVLKKRYKEDYNFPNKTVHKKDLNRFIKLLADVPEYVDIFKDFRIFKNTSGNWGKPSEIYLDSPFGNTGLSLYYKLFGEKADRFPLSEMYLKNMPPREKLIDFAIKAGAIVQMEIKEVSCHDNRDWDLLRTAPGHNFTSTSINRDFIIPKFELFMASPTVDKSRIIWKKLEIEGNSSTILYARYRKNESNTAHHANSQLVYQLRETPWIPQGNDTFVIPAEATPSLLPSGFRYDPGWKWVKAICFGEEYQKKTEHHQKKMDAARELGFEDEKTLESAKWFAKLKPKEQQRLIQLHEQTQILELPDLEPKEFSRRKNKIEEQASDAPDRLFEKRSRSVSVGRDAVKKDTGPYLHHQYTTEDGIMICQICKAALPFKLANGDYYFEMVEFLSELKKHHYQNYLSLCPNHAAMFKYANGSRKTMEKLFMEISGNELSIVLANEEMTIHFTKTHILDLKTIIESDLDEELRISHPQKEEQDG